MAPLKFSAWLLAALGVFQACGDTQSVAVTEGGNTGLSGRLVDSTGLGIEGVLVRVRPASYVSGVSASVLFKQNAQSSNARRAVDLYTDSSGAYHIDSLPAGTYTLEGAKQGNGRKMAVLREAILDSLGTAYWSTDTLRAVASVHGYVDDSLLQAGYRYVQIIGLERLAKADPLTGEFSLDDLPPGSYKLRFVGSLSDSLPARTLQTRVYENEDHELGRTHGTDEDHSDIYEDRFYEDNQEPVE